MVNRGWVNPPREADPGEDRRCPRSHFLQFEPSDYESWKRTFDADPAGRKQSAQGHTVWRGSDRPNEVFVLVEFASVDDARMFRERLLASGVLSRSSVTTGPTVIERVASVTY